MIYFKYLRYVIRHKWFVMLECWKMCLFWQGITHDLSKFLPSEFGPYARYFMGNIKKGRDKTGYYKPYDTGNKAFDRAWFLHWHRNDHHWQYWTNPLDGGGCDPIRMPPSAAKEMVCDWRGAGRAQGTPDTLKWYIKNRDKLVLHPYTRNHVEVLIGFNPEEQ